MSQNLSRLTDPCFFRGIYIMRPTPCYQAPSWENSSVRKSISQKAQQRRESLIVIAFSSFNFAPLPCQEKQEGTGASKKQNGTKLYFASDKFGTESPCAFLCVCVSILMFANPDLTHIFFFFTIKDQKAERTTGQKKKQTTHRNQPPRHVDKPRTVHNAQRVVLNHDINS